MQITIHDTNELSPLDITILAAVVGQPGVANKVADAVEATTPTAPKAAKKAAPAAKKAAAKPEPTPEPEEAEEAAPEADEADEDLVGNEDEPTMADAVELATQLVSDGEAPRVKAALAEVGVKRVSELKGDGIATFVNALR